MRWQDQRESGNVIDERGQGIGGRHITIGGVILALVISYFTGTNPLQIISLMMSSPGAGQPGARASYNPTQQEEDAKKLLSVVLASTEDVWKEKFSEAGRNYTDPKLVLFTDAVDSACGMSSSATGPFYCPGDERLYIDIGFLGELQSRLGATGDFAAAYVVAHEVGHHVQKLLGFEQKIRRLQEQTGDGNAYQVKMELQADCLAGVWGHYAEQRGMLDVGDIEEGINAAKSVGDDRIQSMQGHPVNPDSFTHGSGADRARWFKTGLASGEIESCNTL